MSDAAKCTQRWISSCVFVCGVVAASACVLTVAVEDPTALRSGNIWRFAGFCSGPLFLAAIGIWLGTRNLLVVWGTRLAALPVLYVGGAFILNCCGIVSTLASGGQLKETWQSSFGVHWGMIAGLIAWPFALLTVCVGYNPPRLGRSLFLRHRETSHNPPKE